MKKVCFFSGLVSGVAAQNDYQWPAYREIEYAVPRVVPDKFATYAPPYASLSRLVPNQTTTSWPVDATPTDQSETYGRYALSSLWQDIPVTTGPFSTTVEPTPLPSQELVKPPPLPLDGGKPSCLGFPKNISWGFAGAALQIEGALRDEGRGPSVWESRNKGNYTGKNGGPPDVAAMNYYLYKQDIARMAAIGVESYSFSVSWPRVVPFGVAGSPINEEAIDHYDSVIDTILEYGMKPVVTLFHWDTPVYYADGTVMAVSHPEFVEGWMYYAKTVLAHYSDRVGTWYSFNEPTIQGNAQGNWSYTKNILDAHASIVNWYRDEIKGNGLWSFKMELSGTGFSLPLDPANHSDVEAAVRRNDFNLAMFTNPVFLGRNVPQSMQAVGFPTYTDEELEFYKGTADFFAFDVYTATYHSAPDSGILACEGDIEHPLYPACTRTQRNRTSAWQENYYGNVDRIAVPPDGVRAMLGYFHHTYPTKHGITIGEFGLPPYHATEMSVEQHVMDPAQGNFYVPFLREVLKSINYDGVKMKGVFGWSYLDNWEWGQYDDMYGVQVYNKTTMQRRFKRAIFDFTDFMLQHTAEE
ncbi:beta-glucosidase A [Emericellopsis cladophorae]|uniref:Beta-glucosidase A n=1 Tax=Emericellopsis cladophorae TaxID=2686198 RepID=A0A9P9XX96_9HYPO|nr:beta-glucosidase A [Emericellopsis cladophorae]KAI6779253.1 beta-glucosidase A [Emericellopsis cladophorae]